MENTAATCEEMILTKTEAELRLDLLNRLEKTGRKMRGWQQDYFLAAAMTGGNYAKKMTALSKAKKLEPQFDTILRALAVFHLPPEERRVNLVTNLFDQVEYDCEEKDPYADLAETTGTALLR